MVALQPTLFTYLDNIFIRKTFCIKGRSPGFVVMERDSRSEGCGFESRHCILDGHFFTYTCRKNCNAVCLKRPKINEKQAGVGPFNISSRCHKKQCRYIIEWLVSSLTGKHLVQMVTYFLFGRIQSWQTRDQAHSENSPYGGECSLTLFSLIPN